MKRALVSVSDKHNLDKLARRLHDAGVQLISTGGSAKFIEAQSLPVTPVDEVTNFPEMLDGRVKTLHPAIHGGILARRGMPEHVAKLEEHKIDTIDVVVVNLYPFRATVTNPDKTPTWEEAVENIDIGGPAMIRAAAKNHDDVLVVVDPADYDEVCDAIESKSVDANLRRRLAWKAFQHCAAYDASVSEWLWDNAGFAEPNSLPPAAVIPVSQSVPLRYGENPHQPAAFYQDDSLRENGGGGVARAVQHHGKEMSYNNYLDADAAYSCVSDIKEDACVIVKHTNPCGAAVVGANRDLLEAYRCAVRADHISAFGGIVAFNTTVDADLAREIREFRSPEDGETRMFYEIVIAPSYTPEGLEVLKGKSKTLRILEAPPRDAAKLSWRQVGGGFLAQSADDVTGDTASFEKAAEATATDEQMTDLRLAWTIVKHVKSNAIAVAKDGRLLGMGSGQPNRVNSVRIALEKAGDEAKGSSLASDAFFPFSWNDSVEKACQAGVSVIAHPGGSMRDSDAVECCDKYGVALFTTGVRHFKH